MRCTATTPHGGVDVRGERQRLESWRAVGPQRETQEVLVVEIAVGHAHRHSAVVAHDVECVGVVLRREQRHLAPDELCVVPAPTLFAQKRHLPFHLRDGMRPIDRHPIRVSRVITGLAGEVARGKHAVSALATGDTAPDQLGRRLHVCR